jgi:hypothetical protein
MTKLSMLCAQGKLQVTDTDDLQIVAPFKGVVMSIAARDLVGFETMPGSLGAVDVTVKMTTGLYLVQVQATFCARWSTS